jgi:hypothetical protein
MHDVTTKSFQPKLGWVTSMAARAEACRWMSGMLLMQNMQDISRSPVSFISACLKFTCD